MNRPRPVSLPLSLAPPLWLKLLLLGWCYMIMTPLIGLPAWAYTVPPKSSVPDYMYFGDRPPSEAARKFLAALHDEVRTQSGIQLAWIVDYGMEGSVVNIANQVRHQWQLGDGTPTPAIIFLVDTRDRTAFTLIDHTLEGVLLPDTLNAINQRLLLPTLYADSPDKAYMYTSLSIAKRLSHSLHFPLDTPYPHYRPYYATTNTTLQRRQSRVLDYGLVVSFFLGLGLLCMIWKIPFSGWGKLHQCWAPLQHWINAFPLKSPPKPPV